MGLIFSHNGSQQRFGRRTRNGGEWHFGRDYGTQGKRDVPLGVPKYCDGWTCYVMPTNKTDGIGNQIVLISPNGQEMVRFGHVASGTFGHLKSGQIVRTGDWLGNIGGVGTSENSFKPHIHVEHGFNPKFGPVKLPLGKDKNGQQRYYFYDQWYCGDHKIDDYRDPNLGALPYSELEELTDMAARSREAILSGRGRSPQMSSQNPAELANHGARSGGFVSWFKSTWLGRLFYGDENDQGHARIVRNPSVTSGGVSPTPSSNTTTPSYSNSASVATSGGVGKTTAKQREEMKRAGFTDAAIDKFDAYFQSQVQEQGGLTSVLAKNGIRVNFDELYKGDREMAAIAKRYFAGGRGYEQSA
ncbi:MAG: hypothetical protein IJY92_00780 [Alphaproteobacteria bacterium]|nr:hypothetical protein [Alphaproteobacteria bacterium]